MTSFKNTLIKEGLSQSDPDGFTGDADEFPEPLVNGKINIEQNVFFIANYLGNNIAVIDAETFEPIDIGKGLGVCVPEYWELYPRGMTVTDGILYVSNTYDNSIYRFDANSCDSLDYGDPFIRDYENLNFPQGLAVHDDKIYIANTNANNILKYDVKTREFLGEFVPAGSGGLFRPEDIKFKEGVAYVTSRPSMILLYDAATGEFKGEFANNSTLQVPGDIVFGNNHVYTVSTDNDRVMEFSETGAFVQEWYLGSLFGTISLDFGQDPDRLYILSYFQSALWELNVRTGDVKIVFDQEDTEYSSVVVFYGIQEKDGPPECTVEPVEQHVMSGDSVTITGHCVDPENNIVEFNWSQLGGQPVDFIKRQIDPNTSEISFTAPHGSDTLTFELVATAKGLQSIPQNSIVVIDSTKRETYVVVGDVATVGNYPTPMYAYCHEGDLVLSGGWNIQYSDSIRNEYAVIDIEESAPQGIDSDVQGWFVKARYIGGTAPGQAIALCLDKTP